MDKKITGNQKKDRLIFSILIITIMILSIVNSICLKFYTEINNKNKEYKEQILIKKNQYNDIVKANKTLEENNKLINNIDEEVNNARYQYYKNIKDLENLVASGNSLYKIAYLTFDDGPYNLTYQYLKVLEEYDILATFFTIGLGKETCYDDNSKSCINVYQDIAKKGHTMANHTYSHAIFYGLYDSSDNFINNVIKQEQLIKEKTNLTTNIVRFPGGSSTAGALKNDIIEKLRKRGYGYVDWTAQDGDGADIKDKNKAWQIFKDSINENIEVVLLHDYNTITLQLLPDIITYLQDNGYILLPLFYESRMVNK